ncbi:hypothetical protein MCETHM1_02811 [Flavobacteriaceae bacterium]
MSSSNKVYATSISSTQLTKLKLMSQIDSITQKASAQLQSDDNQYNSKRQKPSVELRFINFYQN